MQQCTMVHVASAPSRHRGIDTKTANGGRAGDRASQRPCRNMHVLCHGAAQGRDTPSARGYAAVVAPAWQASGPAQPAHLRSCCASRSACLALDTAWDNSAWGQREEDRLRLSRVHTFFKASCLLAKACLNLLRPRMAWEWKDGGCAAAEGWAEHEVLPGWHTTGPRLAGILSWMRQAPKHRRSISVNQHPCASRCRCKPVATPRVPCLPSPPTPTSS